MSFKKIIPEVKEALAVVDITDNTPFGKTLFSAVKAGGNVLAIAPENSGKTQAAIVTVFNKVHQEYEGSPRVVFVCGTIEKSVEVYEKMDKIAWKLDVTVDLAHDKGNIQQQRNDIFDGTEVVVGTPKRIYDLYIQNGINFNLLDYLIIDDFSEIMSANKQMEMKRLLDSINKTQLIFISDETTKRVEQFVDSIPFDFKVISAD